MSPSKFPVTKTIDAALFRNMPDSVKEVINLGYWSFYELETPIDENISYVIKTDTEYLLIADDGSVKSRTPDYPSKMIIEACVYFDGIEGPVVSHNFVSHDITQ